LTVKFLGKVTRFSSIFIIIQYIISAYKRPFPAAKITVVFLCGHNGEFSG